MSTCTVRQLLPGLRPEPLVSYLAGLGLIRMLGEQADPAATASWSLGGLAITSTIADPAGWLVDEYVPTPVLSPWNNGSGFGPKDKEPRRTLDALRAHQSPRLAPLRAAIPVAEQVSRMARECGWLTDGPKGDKRRAVQEFRNRCPDALLPWIDAAVVLAGERTLFPPLLGTGGNDGRLDFSTNFHQRLLTVLDPTGKGRERSLAWARDLLSGAETERMAEAAIGQFDPGAAGGPGSSRFGAADSLVNPWAYVLLVEGALLFAASAVRRHQHGAESAAVPFTVSFSPDGSATGADGEESRGEIWVPVWRRNFTLAEIRQLFGEARASWQGRPARRAVDFYAATRTLGVARGVDEFVRYGLHRRNGLAFAAVPVDRVRVHTRLDVGLAGQVEDWPFRFSAGDWPGAVQRAARQFEAAHLEFARDGGPHALGRLLAELTTLEQTVGRSRRARERVAPRRPPSAQRFLEVLVRVETQEELRIAIGLASCATVGSRDPRRPPGRTMRQILLPIDPPAVGERSHAGRWRDAPVVAGFGARPLPKVLADVLAWRSRTAIDEHRHQEKFRGVPTFRRGIPVPAADLHAFALNGLDEGALDMWLRACLALDWRDARLPESTNQGLAGERRDQPLVPQPTLGLLHPLARGLADDAAGDDAPRLALRPEWAARLAAEQVTAVHAEAVARLRQAGWQGVPSPPTVEAHALRSSVRPSATVADGPRIAAALVPRCLGDGTVLRTLAIRLRDESPTAHQSPTEPRS